MCWCAVKKLLTPLCGCLLREPIQVNLRSRLAACCLTVRCVFSLMTRSHSWHLCGSVMTWMLVSSTFQRVDVPSAVHRQWTCWESKLLVIIASNTALCTTVHTHDFYCSTTHQTFCCSVRPLEHFINSLIIPYVWRRTWCTVSFRLFHLFHWCLHYCIWQFWNYQHSWSSVLGTARLFA